MKTNKEGKIEMFIRDKNIDCIEKRDAVEYIGSMKLGDSCYVSDPGPDKAYKLESMKPGYYHCFVKRNSDRSRVEKLFIYHEEYCSYPRNTTNVYINVNNWQVGFYNTEYYEKCHANEKVYTKWFYEVYDTTIEKEDSDCNENAKKDLHKWSEKAYAPFSWEGAFNRLEYYAVSTLLTPLIGTAGIKDDKCCVSSTCWGRGKYPLCICRNRKKEIVSARLDFDKDFY